MKDCVDPYTRICAEDGGLVLSLNTSHKFPVGVAMDPHLAFEKCKDLADFHRTMFLWSLVFSKAEPQNE